MNMEKFEEYGTVEGTLPYAVILKEIAGNIKKVTEEGSLLADEFYVISEKDGVPTKGMYIAYGGYPFSCSLERHDGSFRYFDISNREPMSDNEFRKALADLGCDMKTYDSISNESKKNTRFEFSITKDKAYIWLSFDGEEIALDLKESPDHANAICMSEKCLKTLCIQDFEAASEKSLLDAIDSKMEAEREKVATLGIRKIVNGYLVGDTYFATLGEAMSLMAKTQAKECK